MSETSTPKKMRIHLVVRLEEGPLESHQGGAGRLRLGSDGRYAVACDQSITMGTYDRGTTEPWAVRCNACKDTDYFRAIDRPKPGREGTIDLTADGCC